MAKRGIRAESLKNKQSDNNMTNKQHNIIVTIIRNGIQTFNGTIVGETTKGYYVSFDQSSPAKEWFAKESINCSCKLVGVNN